jgi:hypothetical protein
MRADSAVVSGESVHVRGLRRRQVGMVGLSIVATPDRRIRVRLPVPAARSVHERTSDMSAAMCGGSVAANWLVVGAGVDVEVAPALVGGEAPRQAVSGDGLEVVEAQRPDLHEAVTGGGHEL